MAAFRTAQIRSILLKGAAFARWLYDDGVVRSYGDTDLLISAADRPRAEQVLSGLGYSPSFSDRDFPPYDRELHAYTWSRRHRPSVDLHLTLDGASAPPEIVWAALSQETDSIELEGVNVEILRPAAQAVQVALHAAAHGPAFSGPLEDLARALDRLDRKGWADAADLASALGALESFTAGVRLLPAGQALAVDLKLPTPTSVEINLKATTSPGLALHLEWLSRQQGVRGKLSLAWRLLVPPRAFMQAHVPAGRWPRLALARAYLSRFMRLPRHAPAAVLAWRRARRMHGRDG